uniref:Uncharacterized protein n=1 Tax=Canis lupus familiaris TaxID=9615 RepID=A0A8P0PPW9_CANLF
MTSHSRRLTPPPTSPIHDGEIRRTPLNKKANVNFPLWGSSSRGVALQESEAQEEIAPGDIIYHLEPLSKVPLQTQPTGYFSQSYKPQWSPFSATYGDCYKPWRIEPVTYHGKKSSHSGDYHMITTHQISFQNPLLGQSMLPVHIQGRKIAPVVRPGYMEYISQYQRNFQASGWNQVLRTDPNKNNQGINKYIQAVQKDTGWQPTMHQHQKPRWLRQEMTILGRKSTAKFDGDTVTRVKCPSSLSRDALPTSS